MPKDFSSQRLFSMMMLLIFMIQASLAEAYTGENGYVNVDRPVNDLDILRDDVFVVFITPRTENLSANCQPLNSGGSFDLSISTNYISTYLGVVSAVAVQPNTHGTYKITIRLNNSEPWNYTLGVYTRDIGFYEEYWGRNLSVRGTFIEHSCFSRYPGNWTIIIILKSHNPSGSSFFPSITLPTPFNMALLLAVWILIIYVNSFAFIDTYFKKEMVSNARWIIVGIMMLISIYLAYQIFLSAASTALEGG
ncbi:hypothetical protein DRO35_04120 [Candidatus Bathyarchaeota archaeon]|nr:MAG: hypothetical protein DRO35_04120 [Candidatus Bathyarchaeota archaeon]